MNNLTETQICENLKNSGLSLQISSEPTEEDILKIIEFLKSVERASGRMNSEEDIMKHYTEFACFDLANLIKIIYMNSNRVKLVRFSTAVPMLFSRSITHHYVIEFDGNYFDINGKHTFEELASNCKAKYFWNGVKSRVLEDPLKECRATSKTDYIERISNLIEKYCFSNISIQPERT